MRYWRFVGILSFLLVAVIGAARGAPLEAYGGLPSLDQLAISPDGTKLAYAVMDDGKQLIAIRSLAGQNIIAGLNPGDQKLRDLSWANNDVLLITMSMTRKAIGVTGPRSEYFLAQAYDVTTHEAKALLKNVSKAMNVVQGPPQSRTIDGHTVLFAEGIGFVNNTGYPALFTIDLASGRTTLIQQGNQRTRNWYVDEHGTVIARTDYDEETRRWRLMLAHDRDWQEAFGTDASIESPYVLGIAPDGNSLIMMVPNNGDATERQIGLSDGREQPPLALGNDFDSVLADPVSRRIIGTMQLSTATSYKFFDDGDQKSWDSLTRAFPGENIGLVSWSDDRKHVVVRVDGARSGAAYFLVDLNTYRAAELGRVYGDIAPADVAEVKFITYSAADGRKIPAYLTLPAGKAAKNLPLIVLPHGGPAVRDTPEFDWWAQALASRGYAVLQPQFRGSDGFGWEHMAAGFGEWGRKMQTDLSDGVRALTADGTVDPKRVCIVGASYGGYAALAGPTLDRGVYRCAVAVSGVSDPHEFLEWSSRREHADDSRGLRYWARFMGVTDKDDPKLTAISPLAHAADVDVPILLIHGRDDTVVPIAQSEDMERALRRAGKTVTFVELGGEDHWLSKSETRLKMLQATVAFLEANNPPN